MGTVGKKIPHDSAKGHVTGEAIYIDDIPFSKNELIVDFLGSPLAHGKILSLNLETARNVAGVIGIYTHQDIPGHNLFGPIFADEYFLAEELCEYVGQPIVLIAAENRQATKEAKKRIQLEMKPYPPILTIKQALEKQQFLGEPRTIKRGNVEKALEEADHVLEGTFYNNGQEQFYLESQAALAYAGENQEIILHTSTQNPSEIQQAVAEMLGVGLHEVVAICRRMGGGFGGKETQAALPAMMAALVAFHTKRPARVVYSKDDDMKITGKRHPYQSSYKVGFSHKGSIMALKVDFYSNGGAAADLSTSIMERSLLHADNAYYLPHVEINGIACKTNFPPNTAFRGFGGPQGMAVIENVIEEMAIYLKKDAYDLRKLNCYQKQKNNLTPYGQRVENNLLPEIFEKLAKSADYKKRYQAIQTFNATSPTHLRGIALTPVKFGISFTTQFLNQGNALVNIYKDGTLQISTGGTEMGQGLNTKIQQIVADEFGLDTTQVKVMATSTEKNNNTSPTAASAGTDLNGMAAVHACQQIRQGLVEFASQQLASLEAGLSPAPDCICFENGHVYDVRRPEQKMPFADLVLVAYKERVNLGARGFYRTPRIDFNRETGQGHPFFYYTAGGCVSEVLIDRFTGNLTVERCDLLMDIGNSINPGLDQGQIQGGFIQGMGWVTNEELRYQDNGTLLSYSPTTYKIPNIQDVPLIFNVETLANPNHQINVRSSKAVGEPPLMLCLSVWAAIKNALASVSKGAIPQLNIPATQEEILKRITQYSHEDSWGVELPEAEMPLIPTAVASNTPQKPAKVA